MSRRQAAVTPRRARGTGGGRVRSLIRDNALAACAVAVALLTMAWLGLYGWAWTDWDTEARPAVDALLAGHVAQFLHLAPAYGGSLILRAPFAMLTKLWRGGELAIYRASAAPCLLATGALGLWLSARMRARGLSRWARAIALLLCVANPLTLPALQLGHPEELLGAVLCVAAVLCAMHDRPTWAAILLGARDREQGVGGAGGRTRAGGPARGAPARAGHRRAVAGAVLSLRSSWSDRVASPLRPRPAGWTPAPIFQPWQIWWFLGSHGHLVTGLNGNVKAGYRTPPGWVESLGHPLIVAIMPPLTLLYAGMRGIGARRPGQRRAPAPDPADGVAVRARPLGHLLLLPAIPACPGHLGVAQLRPPAGARPRWARSPRG